jgi:exonuclease SbcD
MKANKSKLNVLHTSDWHLGATLARQKRYEEFSAALGKIADIIAEKQVDILLVAGDVFDTTTPSNLALEIYFDFLNKAQANGCRHIVITAGNHDSPTLLRAPGSLLRRLNIHVIGAEENAAEKEVIVLRDNQGNPEAIVCAVPYLPDTLVRLAEAGESADQKTAKLHEGIRQHYMEVVTIAEKVIAETGPVPVIGMGHLFTKEGKVFIDDGTRELYIGTLLRVDESIFPELFDYVALGHLHQAQVVGRSGKIRYSGSIIPVGFGESDQKKKVILACFGGKDLEALEELVIPLFRKLMKITGTLEEVRTKIEELKITPANHWIEVEFTEEVPSAGLHQSMEKIIEDNGMKLLTVKNTIRDDRALTRAEEAETLLQMTPQEVFTRVLDKKGKVSEERAQLILAFEEIMVEGDVRAK